MQLQSTITACIGNTFLCSAPPFRLTPACRRAAAGRECGRGRGQWGQPWVGRHPRPEVASSPQSPPSHHSDTACRLQCHHLQSGCGHTRPAALQQPSVPRLVILLSLNWDTPHKNPGDTFVLASCFHLKKVENWTHFESATSHYATKN